LALPLLLAACGGGEDGRTGTTATLEASPAAGPQLPEGFPADFPIYENAVVTAASRLSVAQGDIFAIGMETTDAADAVRSFYEARLAEAPWEVGNVVEIPEENTAIVEFAGREGGQAGTVAIHEEQTDGRKTTITISLPAPPSTVTPTPTASPGP